MIGKWKLVYAGGYDPTRDLHPHKAARAAMWLWGQRYSQQRGGSMTFWDRLTDSERDLCRRMVAEIEAAEPEPAHV